MPRVFEKRAGKDYPEIGVRKGETYYSWTFYRGATQRSKTRPRGSQLTQREEVRLACEAQELEFPDWEWANRAAIADTINDAVQLLGEAKDAAQEKHDNIEQAFQGGNPQMEELQELIDACDSAEQELEALKDEVEGAESEEEFGECGTVEDVSWPG